MFAEHSTSKAKRQRWIRIMVCRDTGLGHQGRGVIHQSQRRGASKRHRSDFVRLGKWSISSFHSPVCWPCVWPRTAGVGLGPIAINCFNHDVVVASAKPIPLRIESWHRFVSCSCFGGVKVDGVLKDRGRTRHHDRLSNFQVVDTS